MFSGVMEKGQLHKMDYTFTVEILISVEKQFSVKCILLSAYPFEIFNIQEY